MSSYFDRIPIVNKVLADAGEAVAIRTEAARAAERHRGRVDAIALEDAIHRLVRQRAREELKLPRVNVL